MKLKFILKINILYILLLLVIFSCGNLSKKNKSYQQIQIEYKEILNYAGESLQDLNEKAKRVKNKMQAFLIDFPNSDEYDNINRLIVNFDNIIYDKFYEVFLVKTSNINYKKFYSYDEKKIIINP